MKTIRKWDWIDIYIILNLLTVCAFFVFSMVTDGAIFEKVLWYYTGEEGADFYVIEAFSSRLDHIYEVDPVNVCQPALVYIFFNLIYKITPMELLEPNDYVTVRSTNHQLTFYVVFCMVMMALFIYAVGQVFKKNDFKHSILFPITILFSYPLFGTSIQRGNVIFFVAICLILAYAWLDECHPVKRELSMVMLSIAVANKITPAVCGISYLKEKDYKRVIRLIVYGILIFFVPFAFTGGINGIITYVKDLMLRGEGKVAMGTIKGMTTIALSIFNKHFPILSEGFIDGFSDAARWIYFFVAIVIAYFTKSKWREVTCLMGILFGFVSVNYSYVLIYFLPAFLMFLKEKQEESGKKKILDAIVFLLFFTIFTIPFWFMYSSSWKVEGSLFIVTYILLAIVVIDEGIRLIKQCRKIEK